MSKFPEELDQEDMELCIKEWQLVGYEIDKEAVEDGFPSSIYVQIPLAPPDKDEEYREPQAMAHAVYNHTGGGNYELLDHTEYPYTVPRRGNYSNIL